MNYTMKVGIISCVTCMFAVALTMGEPIRGQAAQSEKTVPIGGDVTLECPLVPDDLWKWVYWKKNGLTVYSLEVQSNTPWTNDPRYEVSNHATGFTIKDLKKTDSGIYHCKVATLVFIKERGHVLLSVTDQEVELSTTSPGVSFRASTTIPTTIPTQAAEDNTISLEYLIIILIISIIISVIISVFSMCLVFKYRERMMNLQAGFVGALRKPTPRSTSTPLGPDSSHLEIGDKTPRSTSTPLGPGSSHLEIGDKAPKRTSTPLAPDSSHLETRDKEGTRIYLLSSDTHGRDDVDVDDRLEESYC